MINELFVDSFINAIIKMADERGDTYVRQAAEIIKKFGDLGNGLGKRLADAPREHYQEILQHLEKIEELLKSEE